jgi:ATP-binding cassette subfamily F protein 3
MSLLNVANLAFRYLSQPEFLFRDVAFEVNPGDRIGLVGPNGSGKTTLLRLLAGELDPVTGSVVRRTGLRVSYVRQESVAPRDERLEDHVYAANDALASLRTTLRALETHLDDLSAANEYASVLSTYERLGGYRAEAETERVLDGLGFDARERSLRVSELSSGQRTRSELAKLLLTPTDLLLIDEPTNHLDIAAREWLEDYLARLEVAYVMVSHDRWFLERATNRIIEIVRGNVTIYEGDYAFYREQRVVNERHAWERFEAQQRRIAVAEEASERRMKLARQVASVSKEVRPNKDFYGRKAKKVARTARILRERVHREPRVDKPWEEDAMPVLDFPNVERSGDAVLRIHDLAKAYGDKRLFDGLSLSVGRGERWAILGPNGCGKTTLLRILLGETTPDSGERVVGARVRFGYYAQEGENLDLSQSAVALCRAVHPDETWVRTILGCLKLRGEETTRPVGTMSAGERGRVALARLLLDGANLLLLDEPTNHLDIESQEAVEATLAQYPGTILFVSHDRTFIESLATHRLELGSYCR